MLTACKLYISEGKNYGLLTAFKDLACKQLGVAFLDAHVDEPYNRTGITIASSSVSQLLSGAIRMANKAFQTLDLGVHEATHPRLGIIDHISCSPLPPSTNLEASVELATKLGEALGSGQYAVPVFLYGQANANLKSLAEIRRSLGYFRGASSGSWASKVASGSLGNLAPDFGPTAIDERRGVVTVGASPWVTNYNILIESTDLDSATSFARAVSQRSGGIPGVESMALRHGAGIEIACNLLGPSATLQQEVLEAVSEKCSQHGIKLVKEYIIGKSAEEYSSIAASILSNSSQ